MTSHEHGELLAKRIEAEKRNCEDTKNNREKREKEPTTN